MSKTSTAGQSNGSLTDRIKSHESISTRLIFDTATNDNKNNIESTLRGCSYKSWSIVKNKGGRGKKTNISKKTKKFRSAKRKEKIKLN